LSRDAGRGSASQAPPDAGAIGDQVISMRSDGQSFASIARTVGLERSLEAFAVFVDAVSLRPPAEQTKLRAEENIRLDTLEQRTRRNTGSAQLDRKLAAIVQLRQRLSGA
jgi:hypothetical protein